MKTCDKCSGAIAYSDEWDAYYCPACNEWKETTCGDPDCYWQCTKRPEKPIQYLGEEEFKKHLKEYMKDKDGLMKKLSGR